MIVTCESCGTKFKIDPSKIKKDSVKVRCSKCRHVFTIDLSPPQEKVKKDEKVIVLDDSFGEDIEKITGGTRDVQITDYLPSEDIEREDVSDQIEAEHPAAEKKARARTSSSFATNKLILVALVVVVLLGVVFYKFVGKQPKTAPTQEPSSQESLVGPAVKLNQQTQAFFIENVQVGQILVVQGEAVNGGKTPVSFVLLEGKLIGTNGKALMSQRFYAGNLFSKEELAQLTVDKIQERMMRREGDTLSNVRIKPGDKVPFMVIFYNLPPIDELSDYTIEFISAEVEKPSGTPAGTEKSQTH
ncbi:MAG: DUF3426 domain-containing protein [Thermodesulforhabdaceae bacterium]